MNKKLFSMIFMVILVLSANISSYGYVLFSHLPSNDTQTYKIHGSVHVTEIPTIKTAASTWSKKTWLNLKYGGHTFYSFTYLDSLNGVYKFNFSSYSYLPNSAVGICIMLTGLSGPHFDNFDIAYNTAYTFSSGWGSTYIDLEGLMAHEFGHACGLGDIYSPNCQPQEIPTMYGYTSYMGTQNINYFFRTLEQDDINGADYVYFAN